MDKGYADGSEDYFWGPVVSDTVKILREDSIVSHKLEFKPQLFHLFTCVTAGKLSNLA